MSETKNYTLIKVTSDDVLFDLHPISNMEFSRRIYLHAKNTKQVLPRDWALGIFQDDGLFQMYKKGIFTFDDNESIIKDAFEAGVYFGELDFTPARNTQSEEILTILKAGNRANIIKAIEKYGKDVVKSVAILNIDSLTQGVVSMLENLLSVQLTLDNN